MRKLVTMTFLSLDGVMQAPGGPEEDESGQFHHGGWQAGWADDEAAGAFIGEALSKPFDLLLGRWTYDLFASYWPRQEGDFAEALNAAAKHVASRKGVDLKWDNSSHIEGDTVDGVQALKQADGPDLLMFGSSDLIQTLLAAELIDEMSIITYPLTLGTGKKLFAGGTTARTFEPVRTSVSPKGVFMATYRPAGEVKVGRMGPE